VHVAAIGRCVRSRGTNTGGAIAPNFLQLSRRDVRTVVSGNSGPELVTTSLVDGAETISIDDLGLVCNLGVDTQPVEWLGGALRSKCARFGKENLVLSTSGGGSNRCRPDMRASTVAHRRAVA
jgi:hypothetical protein